jgi:ABC-type polysaccharide/polyol phosphate export permease
MPTVRKLERAKHICKDVGLGRARHLDTSRSWFVLMAGFAAWAYFSGTVAEYCGSVTLEAETKATAQLTRASVVAAKVADTTGASSTQSCRHFQQA